jgi:uncharacterized ubiquitin-like protein YukD
VLHAWIVPPRLAVTIDIDHVCMDVLAAVVPDHHAVPSLIHLVYAVKG